MKYLYTQITFAEIPDEINLCIGLTNCPIHCKDCNQKELWENIGNELTIDELKALIDRNSGISCVCFMGGDSNPSEIDELAAWVKRNTLLKVGWYSGRSYIDSRVSVFNFDYIKVGAYVKELGGLDCESTNQRLYHILKSGEYFELKDITNRFWKTKL